MITIIDDQIFQNLAIEFEKASHYSYEFTVGKGKNTPFIISSLNIDEFTHITGLDHIDSIKNKTQNNTVLKKSIFKKLSVEILNTQICHHVISNKFAHLSMVLLIL